MQVSSLEIRAKKQISEKNCEICSISLQYLPSRAGAHVASLQENCPLLHSSFWSRVLAEAQRPRQISLRSLCQACLQRPENKSCVQKITQQMLHM